MNFSQHYLTDICLLHQLSDLLEGLCDHLKLLPKPAEQVTYILLGVEVGGGLGGMCQFPGGP